MFQKTGDCELLKVMNVRNGMVDETPRRCPRCNQSPCICNQDQAVKTGGAKEDENKG